MRVRRTAMIVVTVVAAALASTLGTTGAAAASRTADPNVGDPKDLGVVGSFGVNAHRIAYVVRQDDGTSAVFSRKLTVDGQAVSFGSAHQVSKDNENVESRSSLALWGKRTAYVTITRVTDGDHVDRLAVATATSHRSFANAANPGSQLSGSGHTLVATRAPGGGVTAVNLKTGDRQHLLKSQRYVMTTMTHTGHQLAYGDEQGRIWRMDLETRDRHLVFDADVQYETETFVSADAGTTAWDITKANGGKAWIDGFRRAGHGAHTLSHHVYSVNEYGTLMTDQAGGAFYDADHPVLLHQFGKGTSAVRPVDRYQQLPLIAGNVIAWVTADFHLHVASFHA